jgi:hypothetical protein
MKLDQHASKYGIFKASLERAKPRIEWIKKNEKVIVDHLKKNS